MTRRFFYIDVDTINGLSRIRDRFGKKMVERIVEQWFLDHQIIPGKQVEMNDTFFQRPSGLIIKARTFEQYNEVSEKMY